MPTTLVPTRPDLRLMKGAGEIAFLTALNPWLQSIHPVASGGVEEELGWLAGALNHSIYESQWHIPTFSAWSEARDATPVYREFARVLRTDAAHRGLAGKPRVLKVPVFCENLPELLAQFPDARLVIAHRDHDAVLRSAVSLAANQMAVQSDTCDLEAITARWQHKIALREARMASALAGWQGPVSRLTFDEMNVDWEGAMRRCYAELDLTLSPEALAAMRTMMAAQDKGHHHDHARQLEQFAKHA